ncbi:MAG: hypothetical protein J6B00_04485 [Alphaproteobacteria bacterium]|nr:hypothetical protein [Alphaproteobacteria bacterium]MBO5285117.1 hypothetical protein [Alphaproteobacteria bacterium]
MKTRKKLIRVLNTAAVIIIAGVILTSVMNLIGLNKDLHATQNLLLRQDVALNAWIVNLCLSIPVIFALCAFTLKKDTKEFIWSISFLLGCFFIGYHSVALAETYFVAGAYFKTLFWIFATINVIFLLLLLIRCAIILKDEYFEKIVHKPTDA